jgi:hypothetical protein
MNAVLSIGCVGSWFWSSVVSSVMNASSPRAFVGDVDVVDGDVLDAAGVVGDEFETPDTLTKCLLRA